MTEKLDEQELTNLQSNINGSLDTRHLAFPITYTIRSYNREKVLHWAEKGLLWMGKQKEKQRKLQDTAIVN